MTNPYSRDGDISEIKVLIELLPVLARKSTESWEKTFLLHQWPGQLPETSSRLKKQGTFIRYLMVSELFYLYGL